MTDHIYLSKSDVAKLELLLTTDYMRSALTFAEKTDQERAAELRHYRDIGKGPDWSPDLKVMEGIHRMFPSDRADLIDQLCVKVFAVETRGPKP